MSAAEPTVHASAVLIGPRAVLIRGPSGAGKSQLAFDLIAAPGYGRLPFARLIADDRALLAVEHGRLTVRPAPALAGLLEIRGLGIRRLPSEPIAVVGLVVDLAANDAERLPPPEAGETVISGVVLPRLAVAVGADALRLLLARAKSSALSGTLSSAATGE